RVGEGEPLHRVVFGERDAVGAAHRDRFLHQLEEEGARARILAYHADRLAYRRGSAGKADQEDVLLPDRPADIGGQLGLYTAGERGRKQRLGARRAPPVVLAEDHALDRALLVDDARPRDVARDVADAAHHRLLAEFMAQDVVLRHAVLQRQD